MTEPTAIEARLDAVSYFVNDRRLIDDVRFELRGEPDLARALPRLAFGRGGPRDLAAVRDAIAVAGRAAGLLKASTSALALPPELRMISERLDAVPAALATALDAALVEDPPLLRRDGGFVKEGYSGDLDAARALRDDSRKVMAEHEARYIEETGVKTLRVRHNNILGFYIEVTQLNAKPLLSPALSDRFRHRQTMANAVRFATAELLETEGMIASASERALNLEQETFADLCEKSAARLPSSEAPRRRWLSSMSYLRSRTSRSSRITSDPLSTKAWPSRSAMGAIRLFSRRCPRRAAVRSSRTIASSAGAEEGRRRASTSFRRPAFGS